MDRHTVPLAQSKEGQQQFKNKKQPELTENWTVWKSDNQGDKEETFIQTSRRGRGVLSSHNQKKDNNKLKTKNNQN